MSYIGIIQIEDGKDRSGVGMSVNADGSINVLGVIKIEDGKNNSGDGLLVNADGSINVNVVTSPAMTSIQMSNANAGTTSSEIVPSGTLAGVMITNNDPTDTVYINFGSSAATVAGSFPIPPGQTFSIPAGMRVSGPIQAISAAGTPDLRIVRFS